MVIRNRIIGDDYDIIEVIFVRFFFRCYRENIGNSPIKILVRIWKRKGMRRSRRNGKEERAEKGNRTRGKIKG